MGGRWGSRTAGGCGGVGFLIFFDGVWEFTSGVLMRRSLFSRYPSRPALSHRGLLTRLCMGSLFLRYPSHPAWSLRGSSHTSSVGSLFSRYPSRPVWSLRGSSHMPCMGSLFSQYPPCPACSLCSSSHTPCVGSLFSQYPSRPAWSLRSSSHMPCVGSLFLGSGGHSAGHGDREVGLWREIIDCMFSFLAASLRTRVLVSLRYSMSR